MMLQSRRQDDSVIARSSRYGLLPIQGCHIEDAGVNVTLGAGITRRQCVRLLGTLALPLLAPAQALTQGRQWRITGYDIPELKSFDQTVEEYMRARSIRSGALAVTRNGRLVLAHGYSWDNRADASVQPTSLFRIASLTKPLTATVILRHIQDGSLDLATPITSLLTLTPPSGRQRDPRFDQITVLHLLQHLGGWDRDRTFDPMFYDATISRALNVALPIDVNQIVTYMAGQSVAYPPGTAYYYSNFGYALLGRIIERVSGLTYEAAVRGTLLQPLRLDRSRLGRTLAELKAEGEVTYESIYTATTVMNASGSRVPAQYGGFNLENMDAHGAWLASAVDLARFAASFDDPASSPVLSPSSIERMFAAPATGLQSGGWYYGCGWQVRPFSGGRRTTWHTGSLTGTTSLLVRRWDGLDWVVLFNQRDDPGDPASSHYLAIDGSLHTAADAVQRWPTHDLFEEYLPPVAAPAEAVT